MERMAFSDLSVRTVKNTGIELQCTPITRAMALSMI
jgi:hypothetical protein